MLEYLRCEWWFVPPSDSQCWMSFNSYATQIPSLEVAYFTLLYISNQISLYIIALFLSHVGRHELIFWGVIGTSCVYWNQLHLLPWNLQEHRESWQIHNSVLSRIINYSNVLKLRHTEEWKCDVKFCMSHLWLFRRIKPVCRQSHMPSDKVKWTQCILSLSSGYNFFVGWTSTAWADPFTVKMFSFFFSPYTRATVYNKKLAMFLTNFCYFL